MQGRERKEVGSRIFVGLFFPHSIPPLPCPPSSIPLLFILFHTSSLPHPLFYLPRSMSALLFLPPKEWSPRFGDECFTLKISTYSHGLPPPTAPTDSSSSTTDSLTTDGTAAIVEEADDSSSFWNRAFYSVMGLLFLSPSTSSSDRADSRSSSYTDQIPSLSSSSSSSSSSAPHPSSFSPIYYKIDVTWGRNPTKTSYKRFSQISKLGEYLIETYAPITPATSPGENGAPLPPPFPPKTVFPSFDEKFLGERKGQLETFLSQAVMGSWVDIGSGGGSNGSEVVVRDGRVREFLGLPPVKEEERVAYRIIEES